MSLTRLFIGFFIGAIVAYVKFNYVVVPNHDKMVHKLEHADASVVIATLGQPAKKLDAAGFNSKAEAMARDGFPIRNGDTTVSGDVWLYADNDATKTHYTTVEFGPSNQVASVITTYWVKNP